MLGSNALRCRGKQAPAATTVIGTVIDLLQVA
jgi:hypothetical protein